MIWLIRRFPARWWMPSAGVVVAFAVLTLYLSPVVIDPLFNKFEPLPKGELRSDVLRLADRAGVDVGEVYRVDASRRTTAVNAYVGGHRPHQAGGALRQPDRGLPAGSGAQRGGARAGPRGEPRHPEGPALDRDRRPRGHVPDPAPDGAVRGGRLEEGARPDGRAIPAVALALALVSFGLTSAGNALSRPVEARADAFALETTKDPEAFIELERNLTLRNLGDPDPPGWSQALFGTHPTTKERLGFGEEFGR